MWTHRPSVRLFDLHCSTDAEERRTKGRGTGGLTPRKEVLKEEWQEVEEERGMCKNQTLDWTENQCAMALASFHITFISHGIILY